nr:unnamed protein product [Naegleria fowleri]
MLPPNIRGTSEEGGSHFTSINFGCSTSNGEDGSPAVSSTHSFTRTTTTTTSPTQPSHISHPPHFEYHQLLQQLLLASDWTSSERALDDRITTRPTTTPKSSYGITTNSNPDQGAHTESGNPYTTNVVVPQQQHHHVQTFSSNPTQTKSPDTSTIPSFPRRREEEFTSPPFNACNSFLPARLQNSRFSFPTTSSSHDEILNAMTHATTPNSETNPFSSLPRATTSSSYHSTSRPAGSTSTPGMLENKNTSNNNNNKPFQIRFSKEGFFERPSISNIMHPTLTSSTSSKCRTNTITNASTTSEPSSNHDGMPAMHELPSSSSSSCMHVQTLERPSSSSSSSWTQHSASASEHAIVEKSSLPNEQLHVSTGTSSSKNVTSETSTTTSTPNTTSATFAPTLMNNACIFCKLNHKKCDKIAYPPGCSNCVKSQKQCVYSQARKRGPKSNHPATHPITGAVQYQFIDNTATSVSSSFSSSSCCSSSTSGKRKSKTSTSGKQQQQQQQLQRASGSYTTERSYLHNLELVELERKYFSNLSENIYRKMAISLIPPTKDSAFLKYWLCVSISGQSNMNVDITSVDFSQPLGNSHLSILFSIHALIFLRMGRKNHSKTLYEKAREYLSRCFDQIGDDLVLCVYSLMSYYLLGTDCSKTLKSSESHHHVTSSSSNTCGASSCSSLEKRPSTTDHPPSSTSSNSSSPSLSHTFHENNASHSSNRCASNTNSAITSALNPDSTLNKGISDTCFGQCLLRSKYFHHLCQTFMNATVEEEEANVVTLQGRAKSGTTTTVTTGNQSCSTLNTSPPPAPTYHIQQATRDYIQQGLAMTQAFFIPETLDSHIRFVLNAPQNKINYPFMDLVDESSYLDFEISQHVNILNCVVRSIARRQMMCETAQQQPQGTSLRGGHANPPSVKTNTRASSTIHRPMAQLESNNSTNELIQKLDILVKFLKHEGEDKCFFLILQCLGLKALLLFRHHKHVDPSLSLELMSVANEITSMTKHSQFKYANINAVFPVEIATKIHCDSLHGLVIESSINLMLEYVENLYQQLSQDYMNLLLICEKASLLKFRYSHLLDHAHVCMESYESLKRTNPERFISSSAFVLKR